MGGRVADLTVVPWDLDATSEPGLVKIVFRGRMLEDEMEAMRVAHDAVIDAMAGADYRVFIDIRELQPLSPECARIFEKTKAYSDRQPNFRGSAVWVSSALVALQHVRTSRASGVLDTELRSSDEAELRRHLATVWRNRG